FMLITYHQVQFVRELVAAHVESSTFVFLDESHRIKGGSGKPIPDAVLQFSHLPAHKLVISGTPMPNSIVDLVPQFSFLYPEFDVTEDNVGDLIRPIYVRTTKSELDLPSPKRFLVEVPMAVAQARLYELMRSEAARQAKADLKAGQKIELRSLGR